MCLTFLFYLSTYHSCTQLLTGQVKENQLILDLPQILFSRI